MKNEESNRLYLKENLPKLPEEWQMTFKRMYSMDEMEKPINEVIDSIPLFNLDWSVQQVKKSLEKLNKVDKRIDA